MSITTEGSRVAITRQAARGAREMDRRRHVRVGRASQLERVARRDAHCAAPRQHAVDDRFEGQSEHIGFWQVTAGVLLTALVVLGLVGLANLRAASLDAGAAPASVSVQQNIGVAGETAAAPN